MFLTIAKMLLRWVYSSRHVGDWVIFDQNDNLITKCFDLLSSGKFHILTVSCFLFTGDEIMSAHTQKKYEVLDIGIMYPGEVSTGAL